MLRRSNFAKDDALARWALNGHLTNFFKQSDKRFNFVRAERPPNDMIEQFVVADLELHAIVAVEFLHDIRERRLDESQQWVPPVKRLGSRGRVDGSGLPNQTCGRVGCDENALASREN